jgi:DnaK suppressor protein
MSQACRIWLPHAHRAGNQVIVDTEPDRRAQLAAQRQSALARIAALERDFTGIVAAADAANADDEHDPEGATIAYERQHIATLLAEARQQLTGIAAALSRLEDGSYGRCERCGQPIPAERLAARPAATTCVSCAERSRGAR